MITGILALYALLALTAYLLGASNEAVIYIFLMLLASDVNAFGVGRNWAETRIAKGMPRTLNAISAFASGFGFTWAYVLVLAFAVARVLEIFGKFSVAEMQVLLTGGVYLMALPVFGLLVCIVVERWARKWKRSVPNVAAYEESHLRFNAVKTYGDALQYLDDAVDAVGSKHGTTAVWFVKLIMYTVGLGITTTAVRVWHEAARDPLQAYN